MAKYDAYYDEINNKYSYYFYASIKQYDSHVYFDLYEYIVEKNIIDDYNSKFIDKRLIKKDVVLSKELFLYLVLENMFLEDKSIVKDASLRWIKGDIKKIYCPSKRSRNIGGKSINEIRRIKKRYTYVFYIKAVDEEFVLADFLIRENGKKIDDLKICKPLFEKFAYKLGTVINFGTDFSELAYKIETLSHKIKSEVFKRHYNDVKNCFDIIIKSPTMLTYSNIYKILAPTVEGLLRDYFNIKNIELSRSRDLGQIIDEINKNHYFEKDFIELINSIHKPIRDYSMHGHVPSEKVAKLAVLTILEIYEGLNI